MSRALEILSAIGELHAAEGRPPLNGTIGEYEIGAWRVRLNGSGQEQDRIPPFSAEFTFNDWPAGLVGPGGGAFVGGAEANSDSFLEAARAALAKARVEP